jgi:hypothetical protein
LIAPASSGAFIPNKNFAGAGVGLAVVMKAAQRMGAGFESELGQASRFWIAA